MTRRAAVISAYRLMLAGLVLAAIAYELVTGLGEPHWSTTDYFSYFTELSNLFAAGIFFAGALRPRDAHSSTFERLRGAAVLYMLTTGIVYAVLLAGHHNSTPWVNTALHRVMPIAVALDWLIDPPGSPLDARRTVLAWMAFPLLYVVYTLVRGPLAHWYPYLFLDPRHSGGYLWVAANCVGIAIGQVAMTLAIVWVGRWRTAPRRSPVSALRSR
jgi:hypothetical protein